jgi:hypothetical protein
MTAFQNGRSVVFSGADPGKTSPKLEQKYQDQLCKDRSLVWIKVVDKQVGKTIAASGWDLFVNGAPVDSGGDGASEWAKAEAPD